MGLNDPSVLSLVEEIANSHQPGDRWTALPKDVKDGIHQGHQDAMAGRVIPHNEAMERVRRKMGNGSVLKV